MPGGLLSELRATIGSWRSQIGRELLLTTERFLVTETARVEPCVSRLPRHASATLRTAYGKWHGNPTSSTLDAHPNWNAVMPIRTASLTHQIKKNGARLHLAMASRAYSQGEDQPPSAQEKALLEERRLLKEARAERQAQAKLPRQKAVRWIKEVKPPKAPKAPKAPKEPKEAKATKGNKPSRADKLIRKAENLEAAKKAARKSAKA